MCRSIKALCNFDPPSWAGLEGCAPMTIYAVAQTPAAGVPELARTRVEAEP